MKVFNFFIGCTHFLNSVSLLFALKANICLLIYGLFNFGRYNFYIVFFSDILLVLLFSWYSCCSYTLAFGHSILSFSVFCRYFCQFYRHIYNDGIVIRLYFTFRIGFHGILRIQFMSTLFATIQSFSKTLSFSDCEKNGLLFYKYYGFPTRNR